MCWYNINLPHVSSERWLHAKTLIRHLVWIKAKSLGIIWGSKFWTHPWLISLMLSGYVGTNPCSHERWRMLLQQINVLVLLMHSGRGRRRSSVPMPKWCWSAASWTWGRISTSWESLPNTDSFRSPMNRWGETTARALSASESAALCLQAPTLLKLETDCCNLSCGKNWSVFFKLFNIHIFGTCMTYC